MHCQATGLKPENDYDLSRKVEFMKRIWNTQIANKIIKSNRFKAILNIPCKPVSLEHWSSREIFR